MSSSAAGMLPNLQPGIWGYGFPGGSGIVKRVEITTTPVQSHTTN